MSLSKLKSDMQLFVRELNADYEWECAATDAGGWYSENFTIDARTGEVSAPTKWHRID